MRVWTLTKNFEGKMNFNRTATDVLSQIVHKLALLFVVFITAVSFQASDASAHASGENYVWINLEENGLSGRFDLPVDDIETTLGTELPEDPQERLKIVQDNAEQIQSYIRENFEFSKDGQPIAFEFGQATLSEGAENRFIAFPFTTDAVSITDTVDLRNDLFLSWDSPLYRSLAVIEYDKQRSIEYPEDYAVLAFGPTKREQTLDFSNLEPVLTPGEFVWQGILHVLAGPDHVLFLLGLLMTSVLVLRPVRQWEPVEAVGPALWNAIIIVTVFAIAHSLTLTLTVLGIIQPNIQFIETLIAFSIVAVAVNNLYPIIDAGRWLLIVFFGLFHGMGFASAMSDLQFRLVEPVKILFNFNIGIEIGQLIILAIVLPILYLIRKTTAFRPWIFWGVNIFIAVVAGYWTITRALGL
jgi:hypothetical protein